jgi:hypothetical protein
LPDALTGKSRPKVVDYRIEKAVAHRLHDKRARTHPSHLTPRSGSILKGSVKGITRHKKMDQILGKRITEIDVPGTLIYDNRPEFDIKEFPIRDLT